MYERSYLIIMHVFIVKRALIASVNYKFFDVKIYAALARLRIE